MTTVAALVNDLGPTLVVAAVGDLSRDVSGAVVTDPVHATDPAPGDLMVAVGYSPESLPELLEQARAAGAGGLLIKGETSPPVLVSGLAVVVVDPAADWGQVISLTRVALSAGAVLGGTGDDSLFVLADTLATLCGGPVVIHDAGWQLLAYSDDDSGDPYRTETLLGRRAPQQALEQLRSHGIIDRLLKGEHVHLKAEDPPWLVERYAAAIIVAGQVLGSIWVVPAPDLDPEQAMDGLRRAVDVAALALLRHASFGPGPTPERDIPLVALLGGAHTERLVAERLGVGLTAGFTLVGLRASTGSQAERAGTSRRLLALARSYCDAYRVTALSASAGDATYLLFGTVAPADRAAVLKVVTDLHTRLQRSAPHQAVVSSRFEGLHEIHDSRAAVHELLALVERRGWNGVTDAETLQATWRLEQFRDLALSHSGLLDGPGRRLLEYENQHGGDLVATLRAWFDAVGDNREAATRLGLHVNTVRYRLKRATEVAGVDLDNPDERLLTELQVRLLSR